MDWKTAQEFNQEVEAYRRSLLYFAQHCDWAEFKVRAGRLFDYVEQMEAMVREQSFFRIFFSVLAFLILLVLVVTGWNPGDDPAGHGYRQNIIFAALAGSGFELFFYAVFRRYVEARTLLARRRREAFIRSLEQDFREYAGGPLPLAA